MRLNLIFGLNYPLLKYWLKKTGILSQVIYAAYHIKTNKKTFSYFIGLEFKLANNLLNFLKNYEYVCIIKFYNF